MQKVEGSSPFSRFPHNQAVCAGSGCTGAAGLDSSQGRSGVHPSQPVWLVASAVSWPEARLGPCESLFRRCLRSGARRSRGHRCGPGPAASGPPAGHLDPRVRRIPKEQGNEGVAQVVGPRSLRGHARTALRPVPDARPPVAVVGPRPGSATTCREDDVERGSGQKPPFGEVAAERLQQVDRPKAPRLRLSGRALTIPSGRCRSVRWGCCYSSAPSQSI